MTGQANVPRQPASDEESRPAGPGDDPGPPGKVRTQGETTVDEAMGPATTSTDEGHGHSTARVPRRLPGPASHPADTVRGPSVALGYVQRPDGLAEWWISLAGTIAVPWPLPDSPPASSRAEAVHLR